MLLRSARSDDALEIAALYVRTRLLAYEDFFLSDYLAAMSVPDYTEVWNARLATDSASGMQTYVAEADDALAGFTHCGIHPDLEAGCGEIEFLYVAPEHQRTGLGSQLMAQAVASMQAQGLETAVLWVYRDNERARRFYERSGWAHDGALRDRDINGTMIQMFRYRRTLS